ncbi:hypothetical protein PENTCL1PPCAC_28195 [Pristionchus entomophagus]|uniref:Peptidase M13 C-terminal domain-containing protein n=1 Tax=Pristionchus entomophagus TaxID=358040 RepID=A0AAV5UHU0_9BILA|nr:hypothetical protein PENTCL1PPCAC_28195 [Pristionchus entomophagus]
MFDLISNSSPDGGLFGAISWLYGHELYHGGYREVFPVVMPNSPDARFNWPEEEEADLNGMQIAYGVFVKAIGNRIDDIVYPSLVITQRQLFFYANSIYGCNAHSGNTDSGYVYLPDGHYEVNGRLGQLPDFQTTFQCAETDNMFFPESSRCPVGFPTFTS